LSEIRAIAGRRGRSQLAKTLQIAVILTTLGVLAGIGLASAAPGGTHLPAAPAPVPQAVGPQVVMLRIYVTTFAETGLPAGAEWSVNVSGGAGASSTGTSLSLGVPAGTHAVSVVAPAGYGLAKVAGPHHPTETSVNVSRPSTFHLRFGPLESLMFVEKGLPNGTFWNVDITSTNGRGGPAAQSGQTGGSSICFSVVKGNWVFKVAVSSDGFKTGSSHGSIVVRAPTVTKKIVFKVG